MDPKEARTLILDYAKNHTDIPQLKWISEDAENIKIVEYGDGQINFVFAVTSDDEKHSIILKHARDYAKFDKEEKMSIDRQILEFNALTIVEEVSPGSVPEVYCLDTTYNIIAMENLGHMDLLGVQLREQRIDQEAVKKCGQVLAMLHKRTLKANNTADEWHELERKFRKDDLRDVIRSYMLERCLVEDDPINVIPPETLAVYRDLVKDPEVKALFKKMAVIHDDNEGCFILADCHSNSIFVKDGRCALFDMEFSYIGHPAANLAMTLVGFIIYPLCLENPDWQQYKTATRNFVESYFVVSEKSTGDMLHEKNLIPILTAITGIWLFEVAIFCKTDEMINIITTSAKIEMMKRGIKILKQYQNVNDIATFLEVCFRDSENM